MSDPRYNDYDGIADAYATKVEGNLWNAHYERPAALSLVGDVAGVRVLDAGCGSGAHAEALAGRRAVVTGIDASSALLSIAAERLGPRATLVQADLREHLPFADGSFEVVLASLVLHYLRDWEPTLREFRRVLTPDGRLVLSTHHPALSHAIGGGDDYFDVYEFDDEWEVGETVAQFRYWHRPLTAISSALDDSGFSIERIDEPAPDSIARDLDPEGWQKLKTQPWFIFFVARPA